MKFKNDKENTEARSLTLVDNQGSTLRFTTFPEKKGCYGIVVDIDDATAMFGMSRKKALKFAWAIIDELDPSVL